MTSPVSAIEAIEKALAKVELREWFAGGVTDEGLTVVDDGLSHGIFPIQAETHEAHFIAACNPVAMREVLSLARQAETLQRENAEKDARIAALEAGIRPFSKYAGVVFERNFNSSDPVDTMTATDGAVLTLYARDFFSARALLGGSENAE